MRVKRSVNCLLSDATETSATHRAKLRSAGPASAVNWMLRGHANEALGRLGTTLRQMANGACRAGRCPPRGRSNVIFHAAVPIRGECPTNHHIWPDMDANETTRQRRRAGARRDGDGGGRSCAVYCVARLKSLLPSCTHCWLNVGRHEWWQPANLLSAVRLVVDSMWEDMNDGSQWIFCQLFDSWLTQCGKTGVTMANSERLVTWADFDPMWEEMLHAASRFWSFGQLQKRSWLFLLSCAQVSVL